MRRLLPLGAIVVALAVPASSGGGGRELQVTAREYSFQLSRDKVRKGVLSIEVVNFGMDPHNLKIQKLSGSGPVVGDSGAVTPGSRRELTVRVGKGRYKLWCSILDHEQRGMVAILIVKDD